MEKTPYSIHEFPERMPTMCEPLLSTKEAANLLQIHPRTLTRMARNSEISALQIGRHWRFRASDLDKWTISKVFFHTKLKNLSASTGKELSD